MIRLAAAMLLTTSAALADDLKPIKDAGPYVPSPQSVVSDMLRYADVNDKDFLIDLGSGDGRIVLTAAKVFGARGFGVEIKEDLVKRANEAAKQEGVGDRVKFIKADLFKTDISQATIITMYLLPDTVNLLKDKFLTELKPGTRIVSHDYPLTGWIPEKYVQMDLEEKVKISGVTTTLIYLYIVPAKVAGNWQANMPAAISKQPATLSLKQQLTRVSGTLRLDGKELALEDPKLRGDKLTFRLPGRKGEFSGTVKDGAIEGTLDGKAPWSATLGG
ncbi:MAG: methyltransferase domain-containing protein [Betaproteobacteria bacterium]|nr:methyltransferase domain-containing protein [Betaproteobacteria bacterium]